MNRLPPSPRTLTPGARVPIDALFSLPDLFVSVALRHKEALERSSLTAVSLALDDLTRMQRAEGKTLADDMTARFTKIHDLAETVAARQPEALARRRARLLARTTELIRESLHEANAGTGAQPASPAMPNAWRIEQEIVLLADKYDTTEEKIRLTSHVGQCLGVLRAKEILTAGKRLDFLLQEITREVSTMGAKTEDAEVSQLLIEMKVETAKLREQVQNIV